FKEGKFWAIFDGQYVEKYPVGIHLPTGPFPEHLNMISAATIVDLGEAIGVNGGRVEDTVRRFNPYVERGFDPDYHGGETVWSHTQFADPWHPPNPNLGRIEKPPFYALSVSVVGVGIAQAGLKTDTRGLVITDHGPIDALYAAGNSMA